MQTMTTFSEKVLHKACRILFGPDIEFSREFLYYIQSSGIKRAYFKRAKLFHPDMHHRSGKSLDSGFRNLNKAFHILKEFITIRDSTVMSNENNTAPSSPANDHFYTGYLPLRVLRFGQFLYYSGIISWNMLIKAILWQRQNRMSMGEIAVNMGLLKKDQVKIIIENKKSMDFFGETAVNLGLLQVDDIHFLLSKQHTLGPRLGNYFLIHDHMSRDRFYSYLVEHKKHNYSYQSQGL